MARKFEGKQCVYCQARESTPGKADHVIARGFFPEDQRTHEHNPICVPACQQCNNALAPDEQYMIALLAPSINSRHPAAEQVARGPVTRSISNSCAQSVWRRLRKSAEPVRLMMAGGLYSATTSAIQPEFEPFDNVFRKITKGLYHYHFDAYFPLDYEIALFNIESSLCDEHWKRLQEITCNGPFEIGNGIFRYAYSYSADDQAKMLWLMAFYQGHYFNVLTGPPKQVGDILQLDAGIHDIAAGRYILLERTPEVATLCVASVDMDDGIHESPILLKAAPSCLAAFRPVGKCM